MDDLVKRAKEFDNNWRAYNSAPSSRRGQFNSRNVRATTTSEDHAQVNATTPQRPRLNMGPLSKEEKERHFKEKLCFYCGKPNHTAKQCRLRQSSQGQGPSNSRQRMPRQDLRARAAVAQEDTFEETPEEHPAQIAAISYEPRPQFNIPRPHSAPVNEDF